MHRLVSFDEVEKYLKRGKALYFETDDGTFNTYMGENGELIILMRDREHNDDELDVGKIKIEQLRKLQQEYNIIFYVFDEQ